MKDENTLVENQYIIKEELIRIPSGGHMSKLTQLLAITPATPLTPWLAISNKAGAIARVLTGDYCKVWQNR